MIKPTKLFNLLLMVFLAFSSTSLFAVNPFDANQTIATPVCSDASCSDIDTIVIIDSDCADNPSAGCESKGMAAGSNGCYGTTSETKSERIDKASDGLSKGLEKVSDSLTKILDGLSKIGKAFGDAGSSVKNATVEKGQKVAKSAVKISLKNDVKDLGKSIGGFFTNVWKWVKSLWQQTFTSNTDKKERAKADRKVAEEGIKDSLEDMKDTGKSLGWKIKKLTKIGKDVVKDKANEKLDKKPQTIGEKIKEKYQKVRDMLKGKSKTDSEKLKDAVQDLVDALKGKTKPKTTGEKIKDAASAAGDKIKDATQKVKDWLTGKPKTTGEKFEDAVQDLMDALKGKEKPKTLSEKMKDASKKVGDKLKTSLEKLKDKLGK